MGFWILNYLCTVKKKNVFLKGVLLEAQSESYPSFALWETLLKMSCVGGATCGDLRCSEGEGSAGDGGGQVQALGDLPPQLLVDDLPQASLLRH